MQRDILSRNGFRFVLKPYDAISVAALYQAVIESRQSLQPWLAWMHDNYSFQEAEGWITSSIQTWEQGSAYRFLICDQNDGALVGSCGLNSLNLQDGIANLGYWVRTSKQGLGAATQAVLLIEEFGLRTAGLNRLEIVVAEGNDSSRKVAEKAGAFYEGLQRKRLRVGEKIFDAHMYSLT